MKKIFYLVLLVIIAVVIYKLFFNTKQVNSGVSVSQADLILFWGQGCPHCEKVMKYITDNNLENKVKIAFQEVYNDSANQQLLTETVKKCPEIDTSQGMGVPLAFDQKSQKCLYGDQPIIDWFAPMLK